MVSKNRPVNDKSKDLGTFGGRLVAERDRLGLKQVDTYLQTGIRKTTQISYEQNSSSPNADYLAQLDHLGFDIVYLLTGTRSAQSLTPEIQNLVDAYLDAPLLLRQAAYAVLISSWVKKFRSCMYDPGYVRYEVKGENDVRYQDWIKTHQPDYARYQDWIKTQSPQPDQE
jgi:transcriptional regulator with XRE-family HTH domain